MPNALFCHSERSEESSMDASLRSEQDKVMSLQDTDALPTSFSGLHRTFFATQVKQSFGKIAKGTVSATHFAHIMHNGTNRW